MTEENNHIVYNEVVSYIQTLMPKREKHFLDLEAYAATFHVPIVQPEVAQLLQNLVYIHKPKRVLEIGTAIGYSASIMAAAMTSGEIVSIEIREDMYEHAKKNLEAFETNVKFSLLLGDALEVLKSVEGEFDLIFIDASKGHYQEFWTLCSDKLRKNGLIVSDNILYKGMIANDAWVERRKKTIVKRMRHYLSELCANPAFHTAILPMGDGVALSYKLEENK